MIDFHTHILPGIDDGSQSIEQTRELLTQEHEQGVGRILATPHFYADREAAGRFLKKRREACGQVLALAGKGEWLPEIRMAAEVYYFPGIGKASILPELCMEGSGLLLLEMPFAQWTGSIYRDVEEIIRKQKLTVILAHVERYYGFQRDKRVWEDIFDLPLYAQINAGSFLRRERRSFALKFLKSGSPVILGSDCHHPEHRPSNLKDGREVIRKKLGETLLEEIDARGKVLWENGK